MDAIIVNIGDELLIGQVLNTNAQWLCTQCTLHHIQVKEVVTIADGVEVLKQKLNQWAGHTDVIILSGGLGPTNDDYTIEALASYFDMPLVFDDSIWDKIAAYFKSRQRTPSESMRKQAIVPDGATLLHNTMGTAPGIYIYDKGTHVFALPGVPFEMKYLFEQAVLPVLKPLIQDSHILHRTLLSAGIGESDVAQKLAPIESQLPQGMTLSYLPDLSRVRLRYTLYTNDPIEGRIRLNAVIGQTRSILGDAIYGVEDDTMVTALKKLFDEKHWTLGLAESCTGGNIAKTIVSEPGVSTFFKGSIVSYSTAIKTSVLGVPAETIETYSVESHEVAKAMAEGALKVLDVDLAASITGIAGPDGGTPEKPVGTFYIGIAIKDLETYTYHIHFHRDRAVNIDYITFWLLNKI